MFDSFKKLLTKTFKKEKPVFEESCLTKVQTDSNNNNSDVNLLPKIKQIKLQVNSNKYS